MKVSAQNRPYKREGLLPAIDGTSNPATVFDVDRKQPNITSTAAIDWVASNRLFFNTKFNYLVYDTEDSGIPNEIGEMFNY